MTNLFFDEEDNYCPSCAGSGEGLFGESVCPTCGGSGMEKEKWNKPKKRIDEDDFYNTHISDY
jgi:DnaJ-class molecular chaperone